MTQSKKQDLVNKINALLNHVVDREHSMDPKSYNDLNWVAFYVRDLAAECKGCADPQGDQNETES